MNTKQRDILSTQENADHNPKQNSTLTEREQIKGTPFTLIKTINDHDPLTDRGDEQWFMVMGDYRVTETTKTKEEQLEKLESEKWLLIMHICIIAVEKIERQKILHELHEMITKKLENTEPNYETELIPQEKPLK